MSERQGDDHDLQPGDGNSENHNPLPKQSPSVPASADAPAEFSLVIADTMEDMQKELRLSIDDPKGFGINLSEPIDTGISLEERTHSS